MNAFSASAWAKAVGRAAGLTMIAALSVHCGTGEKVDPVPAGSTTQGLTCNQDECTGTIGRPPCGLSGNQCCANSTCTDGSVCDDTNTCNTTCGGPGYNCCAGNTCHSGLSCSAGTCGPCGASGTQCCYGTTCNSGLQCTSGTCTPPCGHQGQACCTTGTACTDADTECSGGTCKQICGHLGQACCPTGTACTEYNITCSNGTCKLFCGYQGGPCCSSNPQTACSGDSTLACDNRYGGLGSCELCGGPNAVCCQPFGTCNFGNDKCINNVCQ